MKPTGYYVLIEMEKVEKTTESGIILESDTENKRANTGHCVGILRGIGPTAFTGMKGIPEEEHSHADVIRRLKAEERAAIWGCEIGNKVEFSRYDGKVPVSEDYQDHRLIEDQHIIAVIED